MIFKQIHICKANNRLNIVISKSSDSSCLRETVITDSKQVLAFKELLGNDRSMVIGFKSLVCKPQ